MEEITGAKSLYLVVELSEDDRLHFGMDGDDWIEFFTSAPVGMDAAQALRELRSTGGVRDLNGEENHLVILALGYADDPHVHEAFISSLRLGNAPMVLPVTSTNITLSF